MSALARLQGESPRSPRGRRRIALSCAALGAALAAAPGLCKSAEPSGLPDLPVEAGELVDTPSSSRGVLGGLFNPAAWAVQARGGAYLSWQDLAESDRERWTAVAATRGFGLGWRRLQLAGSVDGVDAHRTVDEYTLGFSMGDRSGGIGLGYTWAGGGPGPESVGRDDRLTVGLVRRWRVASAGITSLWSVDRDDHELAVDLGFRPIGTRLTLFGDVSYRKGDAWEDLHAGYGVRVEAVPGMSLAAKAQDTGEVSLGVTVGWGPCERASLRQHLDDSGERLATTYALEWGAREPDLASALSLAHHSVVALELKGPMAYRRYRLFDARRTLLSTLAQLAQAGADRRVRAVAINLSGMRVPLELQWELRRQLEGVRAAGKTVVAYIDRGGLFDTMLASVADQVWLDRYGSLQLMGMAAGRTYYKRAAEKLGIGFEELRFFTYKSAMEGYARTGMSPADREQRQTLLDDQYETAASAITSARGVSRDRWDTLVDERAMLLPDEALAAGLVDSVGTWEQALRAAKTATPRALATTPAAAELDPAQLPGVLGDPTWTPLAWGEPARIAVVYAVGATELDEGMRGRQLAHELKRARDSRHVKAVVLRADSPGGDPLASDVVARELRETAKRKPVLVSQGQVAASGGYWISMDGQRIVSSPVTVTGSIGVIAAHAWDDSLGRKVGLDYDGVKRGAHADLYQGIRLPLTSQPLPNRPLTEAERQRAEQLIRGMYGDFVERVAQARHLTTAYVDSVGQGRVWSGTRARQLGLVDDLGGLWDALRMAKQRAGLATDAPLVVDESPRLGWFDLGALQPRIPLLGALLPTRAEERGDGFDGAADRRLRSGDAADEAGWGVDAELEFLGLLLRTPGAPQLLSEPLRIDDGRGPTGPAAEW